MQRWNTVQQESRSVISSKYNQSQQQRANPASNNSQKCEAFEIKVLSVFGPSPTRMPSDTRSCRNGGGAEGWSRTGGPGWCPWAGNVWSDSGSNEGRQHGRRRNGERAMMRRSRWRDETRRRKAEAVPERRTARTNGCATAAAPPKICTSYPPLPARGKSLPTSASPRPAAGRCAVDGVTSYWELWGAQNNEVNRSSIIKRVDTDITCWVTGGKLERIQWERRVTLRCSERKFLNY